MARTDAIVLGAGIVGTSIALHLAQRGLSVALIDRAGPGEATSYGNTGVIGSRVYPTAFPRNFGKLLRIALKQAPEANYHLSFLPRVLPWLATYYAASAPERLAESARRIRPLLARSVAEHEALMSAANATRYLRKTGWLVLYRTASGMRGLESELAFATELGVGTKLLDVDQTRALEPDLAPSFRASVHWHDAASVSNPLGVTRAYAERLTALGGLVLQGDARTLRRGGRDWRVDTVEGPVDGAEAVIALGPWAPDVLEPLGIKLPLAVKRGYHRHFRPRGNAGLTRPVVDTENGYAFTPMEQGIRITTGVEFADRDAEPTPVQFDRLMPAAAELFAFGDPIEPKPWMGARPCFADSLPVIGRAPGQSGLWLGYGHGHLGLSLGPVTGRLLGEMMTGATPFTDPAPYRAERF